MRRLVAKSGSTAMPIIPPSPAATTSPGAAIVARWPAVVPQLMVPTRSVKKNEPSGWNAMSHGLCRPLMMVASS